MILSLGIDPKHTPKQASCCRDVSAVVTTDGKVLCWGREGGRLGGKDSHIPKLVKGLDRCIITQVHVGDQHCGAVSKAGHVYTWGQGRKGM